MRPGGWFSSHVFCSLRCVVGRAAQAGTGQRRQHAQELPSRPMIPPPCARAMQRKRCTDGAILKEHPSPPRRRDDASRPAVKARHDVEAVFMVSGRVVAAAEEAMHHRRQENRDERGTIRGMRYGVAAVTPVLAPCRRRHCPARSDAARSFWRASCQ